MKRPLLSALAVMPCLLVVLMLACQSGVNNGGDDDNNTIDDDDNDDNDNNDDNDDNDTTDDDDGSYTCEQVAEGLDSICGMPFTSLDDDASWEEYCELSEELFLEKLQSPFFNCLGDCVFVGDCEETCFDVCLNPPDPGGTGCDHTVHELYICEIVIVYEQNEEYYIPEMDMVVACSGCMSDLPWDCYGECVATLSCSTDEETRALQECLDACGYRG